MTAFRLAPGYSLERTAGGDVWLSHYPEGGGPPVRIEIPAARWVDAMLAVASPPADGWKAYHGGALVPDDVNERLVRLELERIHYGRTGR